MPARFVGVGKKPVYLGGNIGQVYVEQVEIKGDPREWVEAAVNSRTNPEVGKILKRLAIDEAERYPFVKQEGKKLKMGNKAFWRNAKAYYDKRYGS